MDGCLHPENGISDSLYDFWQVSGSLLRILVSTGASKSALWLRHIVNKRLVQFLFVKSVQICLLTTFFNS